MENVMGRVSVRAGSNATSREASYLLSTSGTSSKLSDMVFCQPQVHNDSEGVQRRFLFIAFWRRAIVIIHWGFTREEDGHING